LPSSSTCRARRTRLADHAHRQLVGKHRLGLQGEAAVGVGTLPRRQHLLDPRTDHLDRTQGRPRLVQARAGLGVGAGRHVGAHVRVVNLLLQFLAQLADAVGDLLGQARTFFLQVHARRLGAQRGHADGDVGRRGETGHRRQRKQHPAQCRFAERQLLQAAGEGRFGHAGFLGCHQRTPVWPKPPAPRAE
jgi:hypothetical protein